MNAGPFLLFLEKLTGIKNLIPDPYFYGDGLRQIPRGGKLGIHADFGRHGTLPLDRRLNVLIYLNRDWKDEYGSHLKLWAARRFTTGPSSSTSRTGRSMGTRRLSRARKA